MNLADQIYSLQIQLRNHQQIKCMQRREDLGRWETKFNRLTRQLQRAEARLANTTKVMQYVIAEREKENQ